MIVKQYNIQSKLGDRVWINNTNKSIGMNHPELQSKYVGPYYITDVSDKNTYELQDCNTHKPLKSRVNAERIKKIHPKICIRACE